MYRRETIRWFNDSDVGALENANAPPIDSGLLTKTD